ncbi:MAG: hypothetical protein IJQ18_05975 [Paludibacteraceae bacterium]|nr:hypothetical protein [Paludibacteraceae bacterium]
MVHKALELLRREQVLEFVMDSLHALEVLRSAQPFLAYQGILEMHAIESVDTHRIGDA